MPTYEVTGPDGNRYRVTAPEDASQNDVIARVRSEAAAGTLGSAAPAPVSPPRTIGEYAKDIGHQVAAGLPRGVAESALFPAQAADYLTQTFAPETEFAARSRERLQQAQQQLHAAGLSPEAETTAGRYAGAIASGVGGMIPFGAGPVNAARQASTAVGPILRQLIPSAGREATMYGVSGAGAGALSQAAADAELPPWAQLGAGVVGGVIAPMGAASLARGYGQANRALARAVLDPTGETGALGAPPAGAPPAAPPAGPTPPPLPRPLSVLEQRAYQLAADRAIEAGVAPTAMPERYAEHQRSRVMGTNAVAPSQISLMELDPALQELAGSLSRMHGEAAGVVHPAIVARQTGEPVQGLDPSLGIVTRPRGLRRGTDEAPAGQHERMGEELRYALQIEDQPSHGHERTAELTSNAITQRQKAGASSDYGNARFKATNIDIGADPGVQAAVKRWVDIRDHPDTPKSARAAIDATLAELAPSGKVAKDFNTFDKAKRVVDDDISPYFKPGGDRKNIEIGQTILGVQKDILGAVDQIKTNGFGKMYQKAREKFAGDEATKRDLQIGQDIYHGKIDASAVQQYKDAESLALSKVAKARLAGDIPAMQAAAQEAREIRAAFKRIKLGYHSEHMRASGALKPGADRTQLLTSPDRQYQLSHLIESRGDVYHDRSQRFYNLLGTEEQMIRTRDVARGGSSTAKNIQQDALTDVLNFDTLHSIGQVFQGNPMAVLQRGAQFLLERAFGQTADVAAVAARKLASTDPRVHAEAMRELQMRMGRSRAQRFEEMMAQHRRAVGRAAVGASGAQQPELQ